MHVSMEMEGTTRPHPTPRIVQQGKRIIAESEEEYTLAYEVRPGVVAFHFEGWTTSAHIEPLQKLLSASIARAGSIVIITNGDGCNGCDLEVRNYWTEWTGKHRHLLKAQHYYTPSPMMRMGLQMMGMQSGAPIVLYKTLGEFEEVVATEYPEIDLATLRRR
jgi:hypothetical protein